MFFKVVVYVCEIPGIPNKPIQYKANTHTISKQMQKQRKHRNPEECTRVITEMRQFLYDIPSDDIVFKEHVTAAIERFANNQDTIKQEQGEIEVPDLGCYCHWSFSSQRIKRPILELVRSPYLRTMTMSKKDMDSVLKKPT
jgi:hypothetical protein